MSTELPNTGKVPNEPFKIHAINNYTYMGLSVLIEHLGAGPAHVQQIIRLAHLDLVASLNTSGIKYDELSSALVPKPKRYEVAFIFDSTRTEDNMYGYSLAEKWIPVVKNHGPDKTVFQVGDILHLSDELLWEQLERHLVGPINFPRKPRDLYFTLYLTNLSAGQVAIIHKALTKTSNAYIGYVDCTMWTPFKLGLSLPQVGLRLRDFIITSADELGEVNRAGYPFKDSGFRIVGVPEELYELFLSRRIDVGIPAWATEDSAISLTALGNHLNSPADMTVFIDEKRMEYLKTGHKDSLEGAGLAQLNRDSFTRAISEKIASGLIYNLRLIQGARNGESAPELNALMYSVQVEFPDGSGGAKRYQVGLKYNPITHLSEVVTFY